VFIGGLAIFGWLGGLTGFWGKLAEGNKGNGGAASG